MIKSTLLCNPKIMTDSAVIYHGFCGYLSGILWLSGTNIGLRDASASKNRNEDHHFHFIFFCKKVKTHLDRTAEGCGKFEEAEEAASGRNVCAVTIMENYHYCNHDYYHYWHFNCHLFV